MRPPIEIEQFRRLDLRVGTLEEVRVHPTIPDLSILRVLLDKQVEVLAPSSVMTERNIGKKLVVAAGLHSLEVGGLRFSHCLMPVVGFGEGTSAAVVGAEVPDGAKLS